MSEEPEIPHYDVAVIGYGPTGVTAANLLGQAGLSVIVVERDAEIYNRARAISTDEEVIRIWQQIGLAEELRRDMIADQPIELVDSSGHPFLTASVEEAGHGYPPQQFIYQPALEETLRRGVDRFPSVELRLGHECLRVHQDDHGVELLLAKDNTDHLTRVRASYVIAADGGSSPTRGQLGIGFDGSTYGTRWVVIDTKVKKSWPTHDRMRFHCDPTRPAVDCPTPGNHHRWEFPVLPGDDEADLVSDAAVWRMLGKQGITDENVTLLRAVVYSHHVRLASRWRVGRVLLAGDAAHAMPPWIGQGMAAGIRDVANLCWKLTAVVRRELSDTVLDSYETERKPHVREVTRRATVMGRMITEPNRTKARIRNVVLRAISDNRRVRRLLNNQTWLPAAHYPEGFLADDGSRAVGHKICQPWVLDEHGRRRRFDELTGGQWTVLTTGSTDAPVNWLACGAQHLVIQPAGSTPAPSTVVDTTGALLDWLRDHHVTTVALRPDSFVYTGADRAAALASPPALSLKITPGSAGPSDNVTRLSAARSARAV